NGLLNIAFTQAITGGAQVRVLDMSGRTVLDQPLTMVGSERNTIDLGGLHHGNYMVQITTADWVSTQRVQVAR
ncbi:MAG TPA: T9SS type A sorting domain-containing protein, partial [Flavobacteriales bacterium]|nr:T9SS type A sorting domain-containing protein [Flavobacteriales bacterium]